MKNENYRWVQIYVIGRMLGVRSPYTALRKAIAAGEVCQLERGRYHINRLRIQRRYRAK